MSLYLDSSLLVSLVVREPFSDEVATWMKAQAGAEFAISAWTTTEISSALSIKLRTTELSRSQRDAALGRFRAISAEAFINYAVLDRHFAEASRFCEAHELGLRASDALHLAIAVENGATVCTLDVKMEEAGYKLGIETVLVNATSGQN